MEDTPTLAQLVEWLNTGDSNGSNKAALAMGETRDRLAVPHLIAAFDSSYNDFQMKLERSGQYCSFGMYRDKVKTLCEALWMIGDNDGIDRAIKELNIILAKADELGVRASMDPEKILKSKMIAGIEYQSDWRDNYNNQYKSSIVAKKSGCFIATAAFGSPLAQEVVILSNYRDNVLMKNDLGRLFVRFYYLISPSIACVISRSKILRKLTATYLVIPLAKFCSIKSR